MRILAFLVVMLAAALAVGAYSMLNGAGFGTTTMRVIGTLVVLQVAYFLFLLGYGLLSPLAKKRRPEETSKKVSRSEP